jgi:hypothetical protein
MSAWPPSVGDESITELCEAMSGSNSEETSPQATDGVGSTNGTPAPNSQTPGHPSFRRYGDSACVWEPVVANKVPDKERVERARCVFDYFPAIQTEDLGSFSYTMKQTLRKEHKANMMDEPADMSCAKGM